MAIENWPEFFYNAITQLDSRLDDAMWAEGTRESWLQTEIMLFGRNRTPQAFIFPNFKRIAEQGSKKFDLAAYESDGEDAALLAVAELKIMAGHFTNGWKCLTGGGAWAELKNLKDGQRFRVPEDRIRQCDYPWALVKDARRLLEFKDNLRSTDKAIGAYLILVLLGLREDGRNQTTETLHRAMEGVEFGSAEYEPRIPSAQTYKVKVWTL